MAVAYDATGAGNFQASTGTATTWTHVLAGTATDIVVVAGCTLDSATVTAKVGSTSMTSLGKVHSNNQTSGFVQVFGLTSPPTGSQTITLTSSATLTASELLGNSMSFTGSNGYGTVSTNFGNSNSDSVTISSTTTGNMCCAGIAYGTGGGESATTGTLRFTNNSDGVNQGAADNCVGLTATSTGSAVSPTLGVTTADWWGAVGFEVEAAGSAAFMPGPALVVGQGSLPAASTGIAVPPHITQAVRRGGYY